MTAQLNDSLDNLFDGDTGPVRTAPIRENAVEFKSAEQRFEENCPKCRGTGRFVGYTGRVFGQCFTCKGKGKFTFKTSPEARATKRDQANARKDRNEQASLDAFAAAHPEIFAWIEAKHLRFNFAADMRAAILRFGSLTEGKLAACQRFMDQDAARAHQRAEQAAQVAASARPVDASKIEAAFSTARAKAERPGQMGIMVKPIKLTSSEETGSLTIRFAPGSVGTQWEGMLFAKTADGKKLGSIKGGKFTRKFDCTDAEADAVLDCAQDPEKAAVAFGKAWSRCGICGKGLLNDESIARGIGPICAEKFGW